MSWKVVNVSVSMKGMKEDPGSYRPVSLTSVPGKKPSEGFSGSYGENP